ncbi:MAG: DUF3365 domain-containing protein [Cyanobacteria bacterium]|nr:DUF3365 domain-containing protein [Cyanobacteriota bacterium]
MVRSLGQALIQFLYRRTVRVLAVLLFLGGIAAVAHLSQLSKELIDFQALASARLYAQVLSEARTLYNSTAVQAIEGLPNVRVSHEHGDLAGVVPLPATFLIELGNEIQERNENLSVRLFSDYPFPWRAEEGGPRDDFERAAIAQLRRNPKEPYTRTETFRGQRAFRYAQADVLKPSCVGCHNTHPDSPKRDWKVGDVRGVLEITQPLDSFLAKTQEGTRRTAFAFGLLGVLAMAGIGTTVARIKQTSRELERQVRHRTADLQQANQSLAKERATADRLLLNILPMPIAERLKQDPGAIAQQFDRVTVLFADIVGFTEFSSRTPPEELVHWLNQIFSTFDELADRHGLEKIKTIGDAYMVVGGLPDKRDDHAEAIAEMALDMLTAAAKFCPRSPFYATDCLQLRIGINTGMVVAGVIGTKKFIYDLWGDTVNVASRMESLGAPDRIQVTKAVYERLKDSYDFEARGPVEVKGRGQMETYWLLGRKGEPRGEKAAIAPGPEAGSKLDLDRC